MPMDVVTLCVGLFSFGFFLLVHVITFRWVRPEQLLKSLVACVAVIMACPVVVMGILFGLKMADVPSSIWLFATVLAMAIQLLLCFGYVLCIFGPFETSVRMRLIREIARGGDKGISLEDLLACYNVETILKLRLQRLMGSGDIVEHNGKYRAGNCRNFFFVFMAIARMLKKWMGR